MDVTYDKIGHGYNLTRKGEPKIANDVMSLLNPIEDELFLDIGCGTGNYTVFFEKSGLNCIGIDPSDVMIEAAKLRSDRVDWRLGSAEHTGLPKESVDGVVAILTVHHWNDLTTSFSELSSVLKRRGRIVIFTALPTQLDNYWLKHYFPGMIAQSKAKLPSLDEIGKAAEVNKMRVTNTKNYYIHQQQSDLFLYSGKHDPSVYLDEQVRAGISSFATAADDKEITTGLYRLESDIRSGEIDSVTQLFNGKSGDYKYVVITK